MAYNIMVDDNSDIIIWTPVWSTQKANKLPTIIGVDCVEVFI